MSLYNPNFTWYIYSHNVLVAGCYAEYAAKELIKLFPQSYYVSTQEQQSITPIHQPSNKPQEKPSDNRQDYRRVST